MICLETTSYSEYITKVEIEELRRKASVHCISIINYLVVVRKDKCWCAVRCVMWKKKTKESSKLYTYILTYEKARRE